MLDSEGCKIFEHTMDFINFPFYSVAKFLLLSPGTNALFVPVVSYICAHLTSNKIVSNKIVQNFEC